jgi:cytochrome P450
MAVVGDEGVGADSTYATVDFNPALAGPVMSHVEAHDRWRSELGTFFKSSYAQGFWVFSEMDIIRDAYQHPEIFSSTSSTPDMPDPPYQWIPQMLDPPEHTRWRQLLAPWFSPGAVAKLDARVHQRCVALVEPLVDRGRCDFLADFAQRFPTSIFMELMGLPQEDLEQFLLWVNAILHSGDNDDDPEHAVAIQAMSDVMAYFDELSKLRQSDPRDDLVTAATTWTIDGAAIPHDKLLSMYLLMFMAGMDTVTIPLGYAWWHLARHDADRRRVVEDPSVIPSAVEEFLRAYSFVPPSRKAMRDVDFHGCPVKAGDMVFLPLCAANRDPAAFDRPTDVLLERVNNNHIGFGTGPHRCLGSHLARRELCAAMEAWHARIPDYHLVPGAVIREHGSMFGIESMELVWAD